MELHIRIDVSSPRWLRRALLLGVPVAALGIANLAISAPKQFASGEVLKAADLNTAFTDLDAGLTAVDGGLTALETRTTALEDAAPTWTAYTPTVMSGPVPAPGTTKALYRVVGDTLDIQFSTTLGTCPNANVLTWSLPPGFTIDTTKLAENAMPMGLVLLYTPSTGALAVSAATTQGSQTFFAVESPTAGGGFPCGSNKVLKGRYAIPIQVP